MKAKAKLASFAPLVVVLSAIWSFLLYQLDHERELLEQAAHRDAMNLATAFEAHVRSVVQLLDIALLEMRRDLAENPQQVLHNARRAQAVYGELVAQLALIDRDGQLVFSNLSPAAKGIDLRDREHYRVHRNAPPGSDRLFISKPVFGRVSKRWTVQFTRPLLNNGEFDGVLVLSLPTSYFSDYFRQIDVGAAGAITLLGLDRALRARATQAGSAQNLADLRLPPERPFFDPAAPDHGFYQTASAVDGRVRLGAYRRIAEHQLVVLVRLAPEDFLGVYLQRRARQLWWAAALSLLLCLVAGAIHILVRRHLRDTHALRHAHAEMHRLVTTDALTGTASRRSFLASLDGEFRHARRHHVELSLLMLDIDHFKRVNDSYGHPVGDIVLKEFAIRCRSMLRANDLMGRLGGEEFAILLPGTDAEGARQAAEKIREAIAAQPILTSQASVAITTSLGIATLQADDEKPDRLINRADKGLYRAKQEGRNRVGIVADPPPMAPAPVPNHA
ncbi:diguanylate cyclase [Alkalilimnicola sp. S0819]|uniref:sensor domain-containing diguanylate cyclase n=1 Tax=Alkalilimnicola sp. S0819 TaxID=2613922 RepID=UPI0012627575|nr:diguanylate cyclase [Alkalilimnicola sp. S0819]KAB7623418.1 GGDEF domain-containing protein [Alkalilimnicola sp. S0819]MPQ16964.1 diguanylate cyclase [Alkalilimnicola sp. S0819]